MHWFFFVSLISGAVNCRALEQWTWQYKKFFDSQECDANKSKQCVQFVKTDIPLFTQMVVSWNAIRPASGFFSIYAQVRNARTKNWEPWHKMYEWGNNIQRSFFSREQNTIYHHVRMENTIYADALRIKACACDGASLDGLKALYVCVSNFSKFCAESAKEFNHLPGVQGIKIPQFSQMVLDHPKKEVLCSPTSCSMLISYLLKKQIDAVAFANNVYDTGLCAYGSWPFNIAHAYECCQGDYSFNVTRLHSFQQLHDYLSKNIPVVVSVRGTIKGAPQEYVHGHLLVVTGWDKKNRTVICHDPAFATNEQTCVAYDLASFLSAWERSRRLAYVTNTTPNKNIP